MPIQSTINHPVTNKNNSIIEKQLPSVQRNALVLVVSNIVRAATKFFQLVLLTHIFTPDVVGLFILGLSISAPIAMVFTMRLRLVAITDINEEYEFGNYASLQLATSVISVIALFTVALLSVDTILGLLIVMLIGLAKLGEMASDMAYGHFQRKEEMDYIGRSIIGRCVLTLFFLGLLTYGTGQLLYGVAAWAIVEIGFFFIYDVRNLRKLIPAGMSLDYKKTKMLALVALPLALSIIAQSLRAPAVNYILYRVENASALGLFGPVNYFFILGQFITNAVCNALLPRMTVYFRENIRLFIKNLCKTVCCVFIVGLLILMIALPASEQFLSLIYGVDYAAEGELLKLVLISAMIASICSVLNYLLASTRRFWIFPFLNGGGLLFTIIANYYFIKKYSIIGAGYAGIIVYSSLLIGYGFAMGAVILKQLRAAR